MEITAHSLWSTPILSVKNPDHAKIKAGLAEQCYAMEKRAASPIESGITPQIKANLYESRFDFFRSAATPEVQALKQFCAMALSHSVVQLHRQNNPGRPAPAQVGVELFESWVHITRDRGYHDVHYHPNCSCWGIYAAQVGKSTLHPPNGGNRFSPPFHTGYEDFGAAAIGQNAFATAPEEG